MGANIIHNGERLYALLLRSRARDSGVSTVSTFIQHCTGGFSLGNQRRKRNNRH